MLEMASQFCVFDAHGDYSLVVAEFEAASEGLARPVETQAEQD